MGVDKYVLHEKIGITGMLKSNEINYYECQSVTAYKWDNYVEVSAKVSGFLGVHDVDLFVFTEIFPN